MADEMIPEDVRERMVLLAQPVPMRRGSVSERSMKCGRKECRCHHDPKARHGPYYSLTRVEEGRTRSRYLNREQAALARRQIEAGHRFREKVEAYRQACEQWADAELEGCTTDGAGEAKKGAS